MPPAVAEAGRAARAAQVRPGPGDHGTTPRATHGRPTASTGPRRGRSEPSGDRGRRGGGGSNCASRSSSRTASAGGVGVRASRSSRSGPRTRDRRPDQTRAWSRTSCCSRASARDSRVVQADSEIPSRCAAARGSRSRITRSAITSRSPALSRWSPASTAADRSLEMPGPSERSATRATAARSAAGAARGGSGRASRARHHEQPGPRPRPAGVVVVERAQRALHGLRRQVLRDARVTGRVEQEPVDVVEVAAGDLRELHAPSYAARATPSHPPAESDDAALRSPSPALRAIPPPPGPLVRRHCGGGGSRAGRAGRPQWRPRSQRASRYAHRRCARRTSAWSSPGSPPPPCSSAARS